MTDYTKLIERLHASLCPNKLEAEIKEAIEALQAENEGLKDSFNSVLELLKEKDAAPKALEPLTDEQIDAIMPQPSEFGMHQPPWSGSDLKILRAMSRAIEARHGITKGTP